MTELKRAEALLYKQLPIIKLLIGSWYVGRGRNGNVGRWNGNSFEVITNCLVYNGSFRTKQKTKPGIKFEPYFTAEEGCFQPFKKISLNQTEIPITHIAIKQLELGRFYVADYQQLLIGRWEGACFSMFKNTDVQSYAEIEFNNHCDLKGSFRPLLLVNEGLVIEPYIENGRKHLVYASMMNFKL